VLSFPTYVSLYQRGNHEHSERRIRLKFFHVRRATPIIETCRNFDDTAFRTEYGLECLDDREAAFPHLVIYRAFGHKDVRPLWASRVSPSSYRGRRGEGRAELIIAGA